MFRSLSTKLALAFLAVTATTIILFAFFVFAATRQRFNQFVVDRQQEEFVSLLATYYQVNGSWENVQNIFRPGFGQGPGRYGLGGFAGQGNPNPNSDERRPFVLVDTNRTVVLPGLGYLVGEQIDPDADLPGIQIVIDEALVGTLHLRPEDIRPAAVDAAGFLNSVTQAMIFSALLASVFALALGIFLSRTLTGPLRELTRATREMAAGNLDQQVPVHSQDELGELATSFNQMSNDLSHAVTQRRQMTADIAHDLRTPLSVIMGYTEMLQDGILPGTPETYTILHEESQHLSRLVEDLRTLSLADAGELPLVKEHVAPQELIQRAAQGLGHQAELKGVGVQVEMETDLPLVDVDPDRLDQVLDNLISNALRHTPAGGQITLGAGRDNGQVQLRVADNGEGIPAEHLPFLFDRFYRVDEARSEDSSGLGLAIARSIIQLHKGQIRVQSEPGRGTTFFIHLPAVA